jgi:FkbM family methyltransferase
VSLGRLAQLALGDRPLGVVDVGATGGLFPQVAPIVRHVAAIGFDPDAEECARLNDEAEANGLAHRFLPVAVTGEDGERDLYVTRKRSSSSLLPPNAAYHARYPNAERMDHVDTFRIPTRSLGGVLDELAFMPEVLKLDVHGVEAEILHSLSAAQWGSLLGVYAELLVGSQYVGQASFADVDPILRAHGFELVHVQRHSVRRAGFDAWHFTSRGQLEYFDTLYLRRAEDVDARRLALVAALFGHNDVALEALGDDAAAVEVRRLARRSGPLTRRLGTALIALGEAGRRLYGATDGWWSTDGPTDPV